MESQISGLNQAVRNANDAISLVQTAEGALQETTGILQRIRELAIQSAGGAPSNADRVNLNKEVIQLQEELARIANTTRFNGGLLLNGSFVDTDFQIGQSNNEEITVSIGDVRPERIGAYTQRTVDNVGLVTSGAALEEIDNGVQQQTLVLQVGTEIPRTVAINKGDDARTISDKMNQAGAQINSTAVTRSNVYIDGYGSFSFKISSSSTADIQDVITVGATAGSQAAALAAEVNRGFSEHNISASIKVDDDGVEYVELLQDDGYDIMIEDYVTTGDSALDFDMDGEAELTGAYGKTATVVGGSITIDAPASFLISSDDTLNTILQGTRASLEVTGVNNDPTAYQDATFDVTVNGVTRTISLAAPPPSEPLPATSAVATMEFIAPAQTQAASGQQIGAFRPATYTVGQITTRAGNDIGDETTQFSLNVNGLGRQNFDMAQALTDLGVSSSDTITKAQFVSAMQTTINQNGLLTGDNAVTVSVNQSGQVVLDVAGGAGTIVFEEHVNQRAATVKTIATADVTIATDRISITDHGFVTGDAVVYGDGSGTALGGLTNAATYYVIRVDDDTIQLASSASNATAGTAIDLTGTGNAAQTLTKAVANGMATTLTASSNPSTAGSSSESGTGGQVILGASDNVTNGDSATAGSVKPFGVTNRVIAGATSHTIATTDVDTTNDDVTISSHGYITGQKLTYDDGGGTALGGLTDGTDYWVIKVDANTIQLAESYSDAIAGIAITLTGTGNASQTFTHSNDEFTIAINGGAATTIDIPDDTYYTMEQLATAIQAGIDDSPFAQTGSFPIVVSVTEDSNGDQGITFSSADGHSIELGGTEFLSDYKAFNINPAATAPDVGTLIDRTYTVTYSGGVTSNAATKLAVSVNGSDFIDLDIATHLDTAGVDSANVTKTQFVTALQAAFDAQTALAGDNAITVSVTDAGLVKLDVAGGSGSITVREHSDTIQAGANGLVETLTGLNSNEDHVGNTITDGGASQSSTTGSITLGSVANAAILADGLDSSDSNYVKTFGIAPITLSASNNALSISINSGATTTVSVAAGTYTTMSEFAAAVQSAIDNSPQLTGQVTVGALQDSSTPYGHGLTFTSPDGYSIDYSGTLISDALERTVATTAVNTTTEVITMTGHSFSTGDAVKYSANGGTALGGLTDTATYYVIKVSNDTFKLATTSANATAGTAIDLTGTGNSAQAFGLVEGTVAALSSAPAGAAASRSAVAAGAYSNGIDLSSDNSVIIEVIDNQTGSITTKTVALDSSSDSVSFADFANYLEAAGNTSFLAEGYTFASSGSGSTYQMILEPAGDYTVSFSGASITQAFGGPVSATGAPSNMDGLTFESMDDVVAELNAQLAANGIAMTATFNRGGDTFNFMVNSGPADASSTISLSGDDLIDLGFTGSLSAIGGGVHRTEEVRYVSQIDISTRESASLAMTVVDAALETLASVRGGLGAVANRLESTISNLMNIAENTSAAMSRVMDADFAAESTRLARAQILQETSVAMLAQANAASQTVLKLLQ
jgi:flagellin-like hook-associated protein FlgL